MKVCLLTKKIGKEPNIMHGILRYSSNLIKGLAKRNFTVYVPSDFNAGRYSIFRSLYHDLVLNPACMTRSRMSKVDVYHALFPSQGFFLPFTQRSAVTFHDTAPYEAIGGDMIDILWRFYEKVAYRCAKHAGHIIAVTDKTKEELVQRLKLPENMISVVHEGVDEQFKPTEKGDEKDEKVIGYIGDVSKGTDYLIYVFHYLQSNYKDLKCRLVICGKNGYYRKLADLCEQLNVKGVEFKGFIPDEGIVEMYNSFNVFVFPSLYEGFGHPILEAQRCGLPVFVRADAKIPEEVKRAAVEGWDEADVADKIHSVLTDDALYKRISSEGLEHSKKFTWDKCVEETINVYEKVSKS